MGDVTVVVFGVVTLVGLTLVGVGAVRRVRTLLIVGVAIVLAVAGAWVLGPPGVALGVAALAFVRWRRSETSADG